MHLFKDFDGFLPYQNSIWTDPRHWAACGFFSLHHAKVFLGQGGSYADLRNKHGNWWDMIWEGTVAQSLMKLAKSESLHADYFETKEIKSYRRHLDKVLKTGSPLIIGSEPAVHWICIGGRTDQGGYVWADSADRNGAIGAFDSWDEVEEWLTAGDSAALSEPFTAITVSPGPKMPRSRSMVPWSGGLVESLGADADYAYDWGNLVADMLDVFWDREYVPGGVGAGDFLDRQLDGIIEATASLTGHDQKFIEEVANGYRDAADFSNLVVAKGHETSAITAFAHKLAAKADATI